MIRSLCLKFICILLLILLIIQTNMYVQALDKDNYVHRNVELRYLIIKLLDSVDEVEEINKDLIQYIFNELSEKLNVTLIIRNSGKIVKLEPKVYRKIRLYETPLFSWTQQLLPLFIEDLIESKELKNLLKTIYSHIPVGADKNFWKLFLGGWYGSTYLLPHNISGLNPITQELIGKYIYKPLNISNSYEIFLRWDPPHHLTMFIHLMYFNKVFSVNNKVTPKNISDIIATAILKWYYDKVLKVLFNDSILSHVRVFPTHIPSNVSINLSSLRPPLPEANIIVKLNNGSLILLRILVSEPAHALFTGNMCLIKYKIVNNTNYGGSLTTLLVDKSRFKCLLHMTRRGLAYYVATGKWDPWIVFNRTDYQRYLKFLERLNKTTISLNTSISRYIYGNDTLIVGPFFYIHVRYEGPLPHSAFDVYASLPIVVGYRDVRVHYSVEELKEYLVENCGVARLLAERYGGISIVEPGEEISPYVGFSIDALGEVLNITISLYKKYYWDNVSRRLLDIVTNATLTNSFRESWRLYTLLSTWGRMLMERVVGVRGLNTSEYIILLPTFTIGEAMDYPWWRAMVAVSYVAGRPVILMCSNLTELALEFKNVVEEIMASNTSINASTSVHEISPIHTYSCTSSVTGSVGLTSTMGKGSESSATSTLTLISKTGFKESSSTSTTLTHTIIGGVYSTSTNSMSTTTSSTGGVQFTNNSIVAMIIVVVLLAVAVLFALTNLRK